jgi:hypothetical protein
MGTALLIGPVSAVERVDHYRKTTYNGKAVATSAASAGIGQLRNAPHEWGQGIGGYARRFGSAFATHAVKGTIQAGVGALRHEDPRYYPSHEHGFLPRTKYALLSTVLVRRRGHDKRGPAVGRFSGAVGAGFISRLWQPARLHTVASGAATSGILLGVDAGANVAREFWPDIRRRMHRRS